MEAYEHTLISIPETNATVGVAETKKGDDEGLIPQWHRSLIGPSPLWLAMPRGPFPLQRVSREKSGVWKKAGVNERHRGKKGKQAYVTDVQR